MLVDGKAVPCATVAYSPVPASGSLQPIAPLSACWGGSGRGIEWVSSPGLESMLSELRE